MPDILIVEDNYDIGQGVKHLLSNAGFSCTYCDDPLQALRQLSQDEYRVLLTDMKMPQISGLELLIWAKSAYPNLQSLMMTAYPVETFEDMALAGGALKILPKPFGSEDLLRQVRLCMSPGMAADLERTPLVDLLQIMALDPNGRLLEIRDARCQAKAWLGIVQQMIVYAEWDSPDGHLSGWDACRQALLISEGRFIEHPISRIKPGMQYPLQDALLRVAAEQDERKDLSAFARQHCERILCYSPVPEQLQIPLKILQNQSFHVFTQTDLSAGIPADCSVLFHLNHSSDLALLQKICLDHPQTPCVLLNQLPEIEVPVFPNLIQTFNAPWNVREVSTCLRNFHQLGLSGHLNNLGLLSQIQLFLMSKTPKRLNIKNMTSKVSGHLFLDNHKILEARVGDQTGEQAFYTLTKAMNGVVMELDWEAPPTTSLAGLSPIRLFMKATADYANIGDMQKFIIQKVEAYL